MFWFFLILIIFSCDDDFAVAPPDDTIDVEKPVPVEWRFSLKEDSTKAYAIDLYLHNNTLFFGWKDAFSHDGQVGGATAESGTVFWRYACEPSVSINTTSYYENYAMVHNGPEIKTFDIESGINLWTTENLNGISFTNYGDKVFTSNHDGSNPVYYGALMQADIATGNWDTIFDIDIVDNYNVDLLPPAMTVNDVNDTLIIFQNRQWSFTAGDGKLDLYCYNISADSIVWMQNDFDEDGVSGLHPPLIHHNKVYFLSAWVVYCFDLFTGEKLWQHTFGSTTYENFFGGFMIAIDENIIVKTSGELLTSFDENNGNVKWQNKLSGMGAAGVTFYNNQLYYTADGKIWITSVETGEVIKRILNPSGNYFVSKPVVHPGLKLLYIPDDHFIYCYRIAW